MWLGFAIGCTGMAQRSAFGVLYPSMVTADGWSVGEVTGAFATAMLVYSPAVVLAGVLVDRLGVKATLLVGTVLLAGGSIGIGLAREIWQVYVLYAVTGGL